MKRRLARELAIQCLYHIAMNQVAPAESISMVLEEASTEREQPVPKEELEEITPYLGTLVEGTIGRLDEIDSLLQRYLKGWKMDRLSRVDLQILRLAVYEMIFHGEVPPKVAINEAIELAKWYGTEESGKFVNGVLGKMFNELDEIKAHLHT